MNGAFSRLAAASGRAAAYMAEEIERVCRRMDKRAPGSAGERAAAKHFAALLAEECGCADVRVESFSLRPAAFYGYFYFSAALDLLCGLGFFIHPGLSLLFGALALLLFVFQFVLYRQVIDGFFPRRESANVTAVRRCAGEVKRRVFLNGHIDAPWEFPLNHHFGGVAFEIPGVMALLGVLFYMALAALSLCGAGDWARRAARAGLLFVPFFLLVACTYNPRRVVDGANDDLSGCMMGVALLREMQAQGMTLAHTEVGVILTGAEEAGLRGAKAWSRAHAADDRGAPSFIISYDTIHDPRHLMVNARDLNGTVAADSALCALFLRAAEDVNVPCKRGWVPPMGGATDSAAFTQGGFRSVGITGLNHKLEDYYHTRRDSWDNLNLEGLENCYRATVRALELIDEGALDGQ